MPVGNRVNCAKCKEGEALRSSFRVGRRQGVRQFLLDGKTSIPIAISLCQALVGNRSD